MNEENTRSRRSVLRTSGAALVAATSGLAAVGTASASYFGEGQRIRIANDGTPCWYNGKPCETSDYYKMPEGAKGICQNNQQSFSCGDFVKVDGHDFNIAAWVNTNLIEHDNIPNTSPQEQSDS